MYSAQQVHLVHMEWKFAKIAYGSAAGVVKKKKKGKIYITTATTSIYLVHHKSSTEYTVQNT